MRKTTIYLLITFIASLIPVVMLLYGYAYNQRKISYDFNRKIITPIEDVKIKNIKYNSYYFAGLSGDNIFLGNYTAGKHILRLNKSSLSDTQSITILINKNILNKRGYRAYVDSHKFYLLNGPERSVLQGSIKNWTASVDGIFTPYFTQSIPFSDNSIVFRIVSMNTGNNSLRKESLVTGRIDNETALEKQVDGIFCTDGMLEYNKKLNQLTYLYYYRNQILVLDTNLNLVKKIKTIDPIDTAKFEISQIKSDNTSSFSSDHLTVNARCSAWDKYLFIQSKLMGNHEDPTLFKKSTVIDVYDLEKSLYLYSFYLPDMNFGPIRQFKVVNDGIITLSSNFIIKFVMKLPPKDAI